MYAPDHTSLRRARQRGLSIIEVMVGMVVALLVGLAAAGSAAMFTASQRQGIGTGGSLINATSALNAMRDDTAAAGLGFFGDSKYLCSKLNLSVNAASISNGAAFTPVQITTESAGDRLDVVYATQVTSGAAVLVKTSTTGANAELRSLLPVSTGQAVLLMPPVQGDPCVVRTITAVAASTIDTPQTLTFANTGTYNKVAFTTNPTFASGASLNDTARVALLGDLRWVRYRREGTDLRLERPLGGDPVVITRNVVGFRAEYGLAAVASGSTALESWQAATGDFATLEASELPRVRAVRIGMVTRSPQREKPNAAGNCEATETLPTLFGAAITPDVTDWKCYRYRTAVVVVPLRNLVMGVTP